MKSLTLKVMHIVPRMDLGGVEVITKTTIEALHVRRIPVVLVTSGGVLAEELAALDVPIYDLPVHSKNPFTQLINIFRIRRLVKNECITLIHCHSRAPAWSAYFASIISSCKYITTFHSFYGHGFLKKYYSRIMTMSDLIIVPSTALYSHIIKMYGADPKKIRLLPHFVGEANKSSSSSLEAYRAEHKIPDGARIIALVARLSQWKGIDVAIEAMEILAHENLVLLLVGGSHSERSDEGKLGQLNTKRLGDRIILVDGSRSNIEHAFTISECALSVSSSKPEGFGMAILEALSFGVPVIASKHGGALDLVTHGVNGFLFEPNNPLDLSNKINTFLNLSKEEKRLLSAACCEQAAKHTAAAMIPKLLNIYQEALMKNC